MLPTAKSPPRMDAASKFILLYGRSKIGKSTWASKIPHAIFLVTDPGLDEIEAFRVPQDGVVKTWEELLGYVDEIIKAGTFRTVIIDTIDMAWQLCADLLCKKYGVEYQNDGSLAFGKGRAMLTAEFTRLLLRVKQAGLGLVLISHAHETTEESAVGTRAKWEPSLPRKAGLEIMGLVDAILFADVDQATEMRVLRLKPSSRYQAGCRGGSHLPVSWPLDDYAGFIAAYTESLRKNVETAATGKTLATSPPSVQARPATSIPPANARPAAARPIERRTA